MPPLSYPPSIQITASAAAPPPSLFTPLVHRHCAQQKGMEKKREDSARHSMAMEEERRLMDLAWRVPETLLLVGTSEKAVTTIKGARELLAGDKWGFDDSDDPASPPSDTARGGDRGASGAAVGSTDSERGEHGVGAHVETTGGSDGGVGGVPLKATCGSPASLRCGVPVNNGGGEGTAGIEDGAPAGFDESAADLLASVLAPEGHLPVAFREITRLVALHAEAGHVFVVCAARLGLRPDDGDGDGDDADARLGLQPDEGGDDDATIGVKPPDHDAPWKRRIDLREAAVRHAHDALLRLSSAASAAAAAKDFLRWRSTESPRREGWRSAARQLVQDARRSLGEAKDAVRLMRDAVLCEIFETWMILERA